MPRKAGWDTHGLAVEIEVEKRLGFSGKQQIEEKIHDPLVRIDNDLAVVWAPFDFLVDGKVSHCGTDLFNLVRQDGEWRIASVADTSRDDCPGNNPAK